MLWVSGSLGCGSRTILISAAACGLGCALPVSKESKTKKNAWSELLRLIGVMSDSLGGLGDKYLV